MGFIFKDGLNKHQKIVIGMLVFSISGMLPLFFYHEFVSAEVVVEYTGTISIVVVAFFLVWLAVLYQRGLWRPVYTWYRYSLVTRMLLASGGVFLIWLVIWIDITVSLPYFYTAFKGHRETIGETIRKKYSPQRRRIRCEFHLKLKSLEQTPSRRFTFRYCISPEEFRRLPDTELPAQVVITRSPFGYIVEEVRIRKDVSGGELARDTGP